MAFSRIFRTWYQQANMLICTAAGFQIKCIKQLETNSKTYSFQRIENIYIFICIFVKKHFYLDDSFSFLSFFFLSLRLLSVCSCFSGLEM